MMSFHPPAAKTQTNQRRIVWDDSKARSVYADATVVSATREEIFLLFGTSRLPEKGGDTITVQASDRIILSPSIAKKLAIALSDCIRNYESQCGLLEGGVNLPAPQAKLPKIAINSKKAELIFRLMNELDVKLIFEKSVRLADRSLLGTRFLLGVNKELVNEKPNEKILSICDKMAMPEELMEAFRRNLPEVNYVYFGYEENEKRCIYKAYLESPEYWERLTPKMPYRSEPFILYRGFKWDTSDSKKQALTRYTCYPFITKESFIQRLSSVYEDCRSRDSLEITKAILETALGRTGYENLVYLEVSEDDNPRKSFDINMYKAKLLLEEISPLLLEMGRRFSIAPEQFHALFDPVGSERFGHLSGGIDREGKEFLTVYYGVERYPKGSFGQG